MCFSSDGSFDFAAAKAPGANGHANGVTVLHYVHILGVGSPSTAGLTVGVADVVAMNDALAAYFTIFTHNLHLPYGVDSSTQQMVLYQKKLLLASDFEKFNLPRVKILKNTL